MVIDSIAWQEGVDFKLKVGCSIRDLLTKQLSIPNDFVESRIAIIFLDGSPVDDIDKTIVKDGSCIALSSQMPGLVGAAMMRKGIISPMRTSISYSEQCDNITKQAIGIVKIKLFNSLIRELGDRLSQGVNAH